jgi:hypothetical protein
MKITPFSSTLVHFGFFGKHWILEKDDGVFTFRFVGLNKYDKAEVITFTSSSADELKNLMGRYITENYSFQRKRRTMAAKKKSGKKVVKKPMPKKKGC